MHKVFNLNYNVIKIIEKYLKDKFINIKLEIEKLMFYERLFDENRFEKSLNNQIIENLKNIAL